MSRYITTLVLLLLFATSMDGKTWHVGPTRQYTAPSKVMSLVGNGDTVEIDPGIYVKDVGAWNADSLVLRCSSGYAHLDAQGTAAQRKAIWVINGERTYIEGIEFSGCAIDSIDGQNGAGIRMQSNSMECRRCYFHDNQEGILTGNDTTNEVLIEACEFDHNGVETGANAGFQHNIYAGHSRVATIKFCYFHRSIIGHELKTRANVNYILYNHIVDGPTGDGSISIDMPNGGLCYVIGNSIEKGPMTANSTIIGYGEEGIINPDSEFYFVNNTVVTDRNPTRLDTIKPGAKAKLINNILAGVMHPLNPTADTISNIISSDVSYFQFVDSKNYDYRISSSFPGMRSGTDPGSVHGFRLLPASAYKDPIDSLVVPLFPLHVGAYPPPSAGGDVVAIRLITGRVNNFPNPFHKATTIDIGSGLDGIASIAVTDNQGKEIYRSDAMIDHGLLSFDRGNLPAGVYHYSITTRNYGEPLSGNFVIR